VSKRSHRLASIAAVALLGTGCSAVNTLRTDHALTNSIVNAQRVAPSTCSKAHEGTTLATAIFASEAAEKLRAAAMSPEPWSSLPASHIVFVCYGNLPNSNGLTLANGVYLDSSGQERQRHRPGRANSVRGPPLQSPVQGRV
jgi:hypothetical protein